MKNTGLFIITLIGAGIANAEIRTQSHTQDEGKFMPSQPGTHVVLELELTADPTSEDGKPIPSNAFDFKVRNNRIGVVTPNPSNSLN